MIQALWKTQHVHLISITNEPEENLPICEHNIFKGTPMRTVTFIAKKKSKKKKKTAKLPSTQNVFF